MAIEHTQHSAEPRRPPFWLSNGVRTVAFVDMLGGLTPASLDWFGIIDSTAKRRKSHAKPLRRKDLAL